MKAEYVNPFYQATIQVFKLMLDLDITRCQSSEDTHYHSQVNVVITVTGDLTGTILYQFPESMTLEMVRIMSGMEMDSLDGFVTSALAEVSNIISGNAMSNLFQNNYKCDISTPQVVFEQPVKFFKDIKEVLMIPLQTAIGKLTIQLALEETPN